MPRKDMSNKDAGRQEQKGTAYRQTERLINWIKKYPLAHIKSEKCPKEILKKYTSTPEEEKQFKEEWKEMHQIYNCLGSRKRKRTLLPEEFEMCKEGNVRGIFGYPAVTENTAKKYGRSIEEIDRILSEYGSIANLVQEVMQDKAQHPMINLILDVSNYSTNQGVAKLWANLLDGNDMGLCLVDSEKLLEDIKQLNDDFRAVINLRYGLLDGKICKVTQVANEVGIDRTKVRQIEILVLQQLRQRVKMKNSSPIIYSTSMDQGAVYDTEKDKKRKQLIDTLLDSANVFLPTEGVSEAKRFSGDELLEIALELKDIQREKTDGMVAQMSKPIAQKTPIEYLNLTLRELNVLHERRIHYIEQFQGMTTDFFEGLPGIGPAKGRKIVEQIQKFGIQLIVPALPSQEASDEYGEEIKNTGLPDGVVNVLLKNGYSTLEQLLKMKPEDLIKLPNIGPKNQSIIMKKIEELKLRQREGESPLAKVLNDKKTLETQEAKITQKVKKVADFVATLEARSGINSEDKTPQN